MHIHRGTGNFQVGILCLIKCHPKWGSWESLETIRTEKQHLSKKHIFSSSEFIREELKIKVQKYIAIPPSPEWTYCPSVSLEGEWAFLFVSENFQLTKYVGLTWTTKHFPAPLLRNPTMVLLIHCVTMNNKVLKQS